MMKKLFSILLISILVFSLSACGAPSPTEVTTAFLDAVKAQNTEAMADIYADGSWSLSDEAGEEADLEEMEERLGELGEILMERLLRVNVSSVNK